METKTDESFAALLRYPKNSRGFDFTGYKRTTPMRRVRHRMAQADYDTFEEYLDVLQASSDEFSALFNTILINVICSSATPIRQSKSQSMSFCDCSPSAAPTIRFESAARAALPFGRPTRWPCLLAESLGPNAFRQQVKI